MAAHAHLSLLDDVEEAGGADARQRLPGAQRKLYGPRVLYFLLRMVGVGLRRWVGRNGAVRVAREDGSQGAADGVGQRGMPLAVERSFDGGQLAARCADPGTLEQFPWVEREAGDATRRETLQERKG